MSDDRDRLGLGYSTFFAELTVPPPSPERMSLQFAITETGGGRLQDVKLNLQLCLKAGETLETGRVEDHAERGSHRAYARADRRPGFAIAAGRCKVDPDARLTWPVLPFNPYANAPEKDMRHAVGVLTVPVTVKPPPSDAPLNWRRGEIVFELAVVP